MPMPEKVVHLNEDARDDPGENIRLLRSFIEELAPLNKAILIMSLDGNSHAEISEVMGISQSNVGTKINRIKNQLKKKFMQVKNG